MSCSAAFVWKIRPSYHIATRACRNRLNRAARRGATGHREFIASARTEGRPYRASHRRCERWAPKASAVGSVHQQAGAAAHDALRKMVKENDYTGFGPLGPAFQALHEDTWRAISMAWDRLPDQIEEWGVQVRRPPLDQILSSYFDLSGWLFERMLAATSVLGSMGAADFTRLWGTLRLCFLPPLKPLKELAEDTAGIILRGVLLQTLMEVRMSYPLQLRRRELNNASHGPFTEAEMEYLLQNHPCIIEIGAGSGYFAAEFLRRGGNIIAQDSNKYGLSGGIMPWTRELLAHNRLLVSEDAGETVGRHADRTLLISWPEPGAAWLPVAVKTHASAGGKHFGTEVRGLRRILDAG